MSHLPVEQQPPPRQMRRKSSANNLLSTFTAKQPPGTIIPGQSPANTPPVAFIPPALTPTAATTPIGREWDSQSLHAENPSASPNLGPGTSVEYLRDLVHKRILTLTYLRSIHEGKSHWFHTLLLTRADLEREFNNTVMKKRTHRFAILGMSLANLLDINAPQDLLRGLLNTLSEYDQSKIEKDQDADLSMRPKMRGLFRPKTKRPGTATMEYSVADTAGDASYLVSPHMPFGLDYHQTILSLLDVLSEVYNKIGKIFGPSPFPHTNQHMILGALSPHPGVSYLFSDTNHLAGPSDLDSSLFSIANAGIAPNTFVYGSSSISSQQLIGIGEMVLKIDNKFKKITSMLLKELDQFARDGIKKELSALDPLLRNMEDFGINTGGSILYDYDG